ncbi:19837_t:CDS:2 [Entrophospora sp. SA101]|nr:19837_t:CDS:2 [Entrophospora sp. SA101]CAJ0825347.1 6178_t:CDS:2 [Entrophospora sp. SA101]CAJ0840637.1 12608_t:CDS:2 [Entrophospora sp. SA101]
MECAYEHSIYHIKRLSTNTLPNQNLPPVLLISEQEKFKEGELFREYVHARRLGSMEFMFLLLGGTICNSSVQVKCIVIDPVAQPNWEPLDNVICKSYIWAI